MQAAVHCQRGRLRLLLKDRSNALADFESALIHEYPYPLGWFYRSANVSIDATKRGEKVAKASFEELIKFQNQIQRSLVLLLYESEPALAGTFVVRGAL